MHMRVAKDHQPNAALRHLISRTLKIIQPMIVVFPILLWGNAAFAQNGATPADAETNCLKLGGDDSLSPDAIQTFTALFRDLYARAGLCAKSVVMDPKRLEQLLDLGELDGDWFRPEDYVEIRHKQVIELPQPILGLEARLIWLSTSSFSGNPKDLKGLTVGYHAGFRWLENHLPKMGAHPFAVTSAAQIRGLLERGRIDVFATSSAHEPQVMAAFGNAPNIVRDATWQAVPFYHLLSPRHADKVARLNAALVAMIREGALKKYLTMPGVIAMPAISRPDVK